MDKDLEPRTKKFALRVIKFAGSLPQNRAVDVLTRQLLRSATSIGLLIESGTANSSEATNLLKESSELLAIFTAIGRKLKE